MAKELPQRDHHQARSGVVVIDSTAPASSAAAQHALMFRRLQRSQFQNALIRHKAQRFVALKALHRSTELRRQLSHARAAAAAAAGGGATSQTPSPPLDPSVKALIEKLTEIAEILPFGYSGDQPTRQHSFHGGGGPRYEQQSAEARSSYPQGHSTAERKSSLAASLAERAVSRGPADGKGGIVGDRGWEERGSSGNLAATNEADEGRGLDAVEGGGATGSTVLSEKGLLVPEDDDILAHQLRELDSNMNRMFQDLQKKSKVNGNMDSEASKKAGTLEDRSAEEDAGRKREEDMRRKERTALLAQLEGLSGGGLTRRPKWRWIAEGVHDPDPDRVLKGKHLWKAAALLIIVFFVRPRRNLMQRKARSKARDTQDWNATLTIYFDRCQTWLLKTARVPVANSVLKNSSLNFRLNHLDTKRDAYGAGALGGVNARGGFVSSFVRKVARGMSQESLALTLMRLKVHAKGVMNGLTQEMPPSDIMTFFSYLAADGNYFPEGFFFEEETRVLAFDELGAVRKLTPNTEPPDSLDDTLYALHTSTELVEELEADKRGHHHEGFLDSHHLGWLVDAGHHILEGTKAGIAGNVPSVPRPTDLRTAVLHGRERLPGKFKSVYRHDATSQWFDTSFVEMILTNYLMVRVLIPWILLYPKQSGLVSSSGVKQSVLTHNCQVLASTVYLIVRVLRPELTPPNADTLSAAIAEETERATRIAVAGEEGDEDGLEGSRSDGDSSEGGDAARGDRAKEENGAEDPASGKSGGTRKKLTALRRGSRVNVAPVRPRTVPEIMQQRRYVSVSDKQLIPGLLPDAYFLPFAEQMRPWVLQLAAEFDSWMQRVVAEVMRKVEGSAIRQERPKGDQGD